MICISTQALGTFVIWSIVVSTFIMMIVLVLRTVLIEEDIQRLLLWNRDLENQIERLTTDAKEKEAKFVKGELYMKTKRKGGK